MGEVHIQSQQEPIVARPIIMGQIQKHKQQPPFPNSPMGFDFSQQQEQEQANATDNHHSTVDPTDLLSMLHLSSSNARRHQPPCTAANNNSAKRPSPSSSGERSAKKLFCDQEDLTLHGFSAISLPLSLGTLCSNKPVFRRCVSDPYNPPASEHATPPMMRGSGLPPLHPSLRRSVSDLTPSPAKGFFSFLEL
ncbi:hypothetical protein SESBI_00288 [Sesbania bispinosa]|nr:hypothetical protein SESBI_00288 [Sesbania bispinosa]